MIACSALVDEKVEKKAKECGFNKVYETPLSSAKMKEIIDHVQDR
jgi:hypothetical protein